MKFEFFIRITTIFAVSNAWYINWSNLTGNNFFLCVFGIQSAKSNKTYPCIYCCIHFRLQQESKWFDYIYHLYLEYSSRDETFDVMHYLNILKVIITSNDSHVWIAEIAWTNLSKNMIFCFYLPLKIIFAVLWFLYYDWPSVFLVWQAHLSSTS